MRLLLLLSILIILAGCAPTAIPPVYFIPKNVTMVDEPLTSNSIVIKVNINGNEVESYLSENNYRIALTEVLRQSNFFMSDSDTKLNFESNVYRASIPLAGATMASELCAKYKLETLNNELLWQDDICYKGEATPGEAFLGATRQLLAFNRTNEGHMSMLLSSLRNYLESNKTITKKDQ